jgi:hypothetical protein
MTPGAVLDIRVRPRDPTRPSRCGSAPGARGQVGMLLHHGSEVTAALTATTAHWRTCSPACAIGVRDRRQCS